MLRAVTMIDTATGWFEIETYYDLKNNDSSQYCGIYMAIVLSTTNRY